MGLNSAFKGLTYIVTSKFCLLHIGIFTEGKAGYDEDVVVLKDEKNENHRVSTSHFSSISACLCISLSSLL
jgi:hypothetical protein